MKNLLITLSTACVLSLSTAAMAGGKEVSVTVINSGITQIQSGSELDQDAIIGLVSNEFKGDATIIVEKSHITQKQNGTKNTQMAKIGIVGCDCGKDGKGK